MNCKQGDIAIVVRSSAGNEGKIVTCIKFVGYVRGWLRTDLWMIDRHLPVNDGGLYPYISDSYLRPIRGTDETLTWVPKHEPTKETA